MEFLLGNSGFPLSLLLSRVASKKLPWLPLSYREGRWEGGRRVSFQPALGRLPLSPGLTFLTFLPHL